MIEMSCFDEDYSAAQAHDEALQKQEVDEAFEHLNMVCNAIERDFGMTLTTTREKIRFLEAFINRR